MGIVKILRRTIEGILIAAGLILGLGLESPGPNYPPPPGSEVVRLHLVDHGMHLGLVIPAEAIRTDSGLKRLPWATPQAVDWVEIGWGEDGFYRGAVRMTDIGFADASRALLRPSLSVLHVTGYFGPPGQFFNPERLIPFEVTRPALSRMLAEVDASFAPDDRGRPAFLQPPIYGVGGFYRSAERYHLFKVCNHWLSDRLNTAGLPSSSAFSLLPWSVRLELRLRAGLRPLVD